MSNPLIRGCASELLNDERLVGDPIDVVTGANLDVNFEFQLPGTLPLLWRRHYDSSKTDRHFALGWGHTHEFDRILEYDLDGLRYTGPVGNEVGFPPLCKDGEEVASGGLLLRRATSRSYCISADAGPVMEFEFDGSTPKAPLKKLSSDKGVIEFHYGNHGRLSGITDSIGRRVQVECGSDGPITILTLKKSAAAPARILMTFRYDAAGNLIEGVDAYRNTFSFTYDEHHRLTSRTDRRGYSFLFEYDQDGRCVRSRGEDGLHEVNLRYTPDERMTVVTKADGGQWTYFYNGQHTITRIIDPYGGARNFTLDSSGRVIAEVDPNGEVTKWLYGRGGARIGKQSPLGVFYAGLEAPARPDQSVHRVPRLPVEWEYGDLPIASKNNTSQVFDELGLLVQEKREDGHSRRWHYDAAGNTRHFHDYEGAIYKYTYSSWDLLSTEADPLGNTSAYTYTNTGKIASFIDPKQNVSEYKYDHKDRLKEIHRHGVLRESYRYDDAGNIVEKLDGNGAPLLRFEIGPGNLKTSRHLASGEIHRFTYDKKGVCTDAKTESCEVQFAHDRFGNRTRDERNGRGVKHRFIGPRLLGETNTLDRFRTAYRRSGADSVQIVDPTGSIHVIQFLAGGLVVRRMSNGSTEQAQYDPEGRCLFKEATREGPPRRRRTQTYRYSAEGDLLEVEDDQEDAIRYEYDLAHRLNRAFCSHNERNEFVYDSAGNLIQQPGLAGVAVDDGNRLRQANGERFEYNGRSHICARISGHGTTRYQYDSRDMLVACQSPHGEWRASYDPLGRRTSKELQGKRTEFYWDTDRLAAEVAPDGRMKLYIYADAFSMTPLMFIEYGSLDADPKAGKGFFLFSNHLGAPIRAEDEQGTTVWRARVDPYGRADILTGSIIEVPLRFPGHYFDAETGLNYNRFRYYSPELGRYLQSDPLGIAGGANLYAYAANPLKSVDVRGDCPTGPTKPGDKQGGTPEDGGDKEEAPPSGTSQPEEEQDPRAAVKQLADEARKNFPDKDERPNTVARLENADGSIVTGQSQKDEGSTVHPAVQDALDQVPQNQRSDHHGKCAEIDAMSNNATAAQNRGDDPAKANEGALIQTGQVRGAEGDQSRHGAPQTPCSSCKSVMNQLGAGYNPR